MFSKEEFANSFGRWVEDNEIVIEDLSEQELVSLGEKLGREGYCVEYWKAPLQKSGHLHIKNIRLDKCPTELTYTQLNEYKRLFMLAYLTKEQQKRVDWNFVLAKRHRIAEENKPHFKGYGIKKLIQRWGEKNENKVVKDLYFQAIQVEDSEPIIVNPETSKFVNRIKITDIAKNYGLKLHGTKTLCPFHPDKGPSLNFNNEKGCFYCFGCQAKGGIIKFIQMIEKVKRENRYLFGGTQKEVLDG
jgi:hypothetical protein